MSVRAFAAVVGGILLLIGVLGLAIPPTVDYGADSVACGSGFAGLGDEPGLVDAGRDVASAIYGDFTSSSDLEGECKDAIGARRAWGYPVGGLGLVVLLGAVVIQTSSVRPEQGRSPGAPTNGAPPDGRSTPA